MRHSHGGEKDIHGGEKDAAASMKRLRCCSATSGVCDGGSAVGKRLGGELYGGAGWWVALQSHASARPASGARALLNGRKSKEEERRVLGAEENGGVPIRLEGVPALPGKWAASGWHAAPGKIWIKSIFSSPICISHNRLPNSKIIDTFLGDEETSENNFPFCINFQILLDFKLKIQKIIQIWIWCEF
jgi:hypothetical protein